MEGKSKEARAAARDESNGDRLRRSTESPAMNVELASAFAGDREMTDSEKTSVDEQIRDRGGVFFSDLLYAISHQYFSPDVAKTLWGNVVVHKQALSTLLGRNVRIIVAALDYLSNITDAMASPTLISEAYATEIANLSMRDGMTGLYNHSSFYELLELEFRSHLRYGAGIALVLMDIDDFKRINDQYGHQQGDLALMAFARVMVEQVRDSDICCRFGGEEFVAILPFTRELDVAREIAERIREKAESIPCGEAGLSVSAGVSVCNQGICLPRELIESADRALYQAKKQGKNQVVLAV